MEEEEEGPSKLDFFGEAPEFGGFQSLCCVVWFGENRVYNRLKGCFGEGSILVKDIMSAPARRGGFFAAITSSFSNFGSVAYSRVNRSVKLSNFLVSGSHLFFQELDTPMLCFLHPKTTSLRCLELLFMLRLCLLCIGASV